VKIPKKCNYYKHKTYKKSVKRERNIPGVERNHKTTRARVKNTLKIKEKTYKMTKSTKKSEMRESAALGNAI
jgi:hypothetical protein